MGLILVTQGINEADLGSGQPKRADLGLGFLIWTDFMTCRRNKADSKYVGAQRAESRYNGAQRAEFKKEFPKRPILVCHPKRG